MKQARDAFTSKALSRVGMSSIEGETKRMVEKAVHQHEAKDHPGTKKTALKLKDGGKVEGDDAQGFARGGRAKHKGTNVNVIVAPQGGGATPVPVPKPVPVPMGGPPGAMPPRPPMMPPPGAGAPPPPQMRPPMKRGGRTAYPIDAGAGGGEGRLQKAKAASKLYKTR